MSHLIFGSITDSDLMWMDNIKSHVESLGLTWQEAKDIISGIQSTKRGPKSIKEWQSEIHALAKEKGWWDSPRRTDTECIALMMCEAAEAIEEIRGNRLGYYEVDGKPEGIAVEIADMVIRAMDMCEARGWDLESIIAKKHTYNKSRPYKHGKKL